MVVDRIAGLRKVRERLKLNWYSVRARIAIQVEGQTKGLQGIEDRIVMVRARSLSDASKRLENEWQAYAEPYLNSYGELVRWQLEEILDIYAITSDIDPKGTEVWSSLRNRRMKKEFEWHGG